MAIRILEPVTDPRLERKSSVYQYKHVLGVLKGGQYCPLVNNNIISISCGKVKYTQSIVTDDPNNLGYHFPVGCCTYLSDIYLTGERKETVTSPLPKWFGTGFYQHTVDEDVILTANQQALGIHNKKILHTGLDYVIAKRTLEPAN